MKSRTQEQTTSASEFNHYKLFVVQRGYSRTEFDAIYIEKETDKAVCFRGDVTLEDSKDCLIEVWYWIPKSVLLKSKKTEGRHKLPHWFELNYNVVYRHR